MLLQLTRAEHSCELLQGKPMKCSALQGAVRRKRKQQYSLSICRTVTAVQRAEPNMLNDGCCLQINQPISASFTMHSYQLARQLFPLYVLSIFFAI